MDLTKEQQLWQAGYEYVVGVDEVGRGPLAGPVVVAAVRFDPGHQPIVAVQDSKRLTANTRADLFEAIQEQASDIQVALFDVDVIDEINILEATKAAMEHVINSCDLVEYVLVDGRDLPELEIEGEAVIKGDTHCYSIAVASIIAKQVRDQIMIDLDQLYPQYDWASNKGYGTKKHRQAILEHGPSKHHRKSFLKKLLKKR